MIEDEDENGITALSNDHVTQDSDSGQTRQGNGMNDISIGGKLTAEQQTKLKDVINKFPDMFTDTPGKTDLIQHEIELTDDSVCYQ